MEELEMTMDVAEEGTAYDTDYAEESSATEETTEIVDSQAENHSPKGEKSNRFADYRRKEEIERYKSESNSLREKQTEYEQQIASYKAREERLSSLLKNYYDGDDLDAMALNMEAQIKGVSVSDLQAQIEADNQLKAAEQKKADELAYYKGIVEQMKMEEAKQMYEADLAVVQKLDPNVKRLEDLGEEFERLRFTVNPLTNELYSVADVYNHIKSKIKPLPQTSGTVNTTTEESKETDYMKMSNEAFNEIFNKIVYG